MVLFYGLLALETANNTVAATTTNISKSLRNSPRQMSSSSSSSTNSWIYTQDLRKHFEERYINHRYIFIPVYINGKNSHHNYSTTTTTPEKFHGENSWIYSRSLRDRLFYSTSKISLPIITNQTFIYDNLPIKNKSKIKFFKRSLSTKDNSSLSSFNTSKYRINNILEENDENENCSIPLIKHNVIFPSSTPTETSNNNIKLSAKNTTTNSNRLTRLRSFFFKSSSNTKQKQIMLSSSSLHNQISKT